MSTAAVEPARPSPSAVRAFINEIAKPKPGRPKGSRNRSKKEAVPSAWHNGRCYIQIRDENIGGALVANSSHCIVAEAIKQCIPDAKFVAVDLQSIRFSQDGKRFCFLTPAAARDIVVNFDQANTEAITACEFSMKPVYVSRAGKSRTHTPSNAELRGFGLRIAKTQPHLPTEAAPEPGVPEPPVEAPKSRFGWQAVHKARSALIADGVPPEAADARLAATMRGVRGPDTAKRKPRVSRARVSTATRGGVPVQLGGKIMPTSILSRREFGCRVLRK
jgi:hypothetical protein